MKELTNYNSFYNYLPFNEHKYGKFSKAIPNPELLRNNYSINHQVTCTADKQHIRERKKEQNDDPMYASCPKFYRFNSTICPKLYIF